MSHLINLSAKACGVAQLSRPSSPTLDHVSVVARDFTRTSSCSHGCGLFALQESPAAFGDRVRLDNDIGAYPPVRSLVLNPAAIGTKTLSQAWSEICWRKRPEPSPSLVLPTKWTARLVEYGPQSWEESLRFCYAPLLQARDSIRLVQIHPPTQDGRINSTLFNATLSQEPFFYALSYEWGPPEGQRMICVNGVPMRIRENLYNFLATWQEGNNAIALWIDAICINQGDIIERNRQVALMGEIYKTATAVRLWVGNAADGSDALLQYLRREGECIRSFYQATVNDTKVTEILPPTLDPLPLELPEHERALYHILHRSYWSRAWIIQELILARDIVVHCGRETISWSYLYALQQTGNGLMWVKPFEGTRIDQIFQHRQLTQHSLASFPDIFTTYNNKQCQDPRDQIYSLLSLDSRYKNGRLLIEVDYAIDLCSLLFRTFNASVTPTRRTAPYFETLRLALGLMWEELLQANAQPRYSMNGELGSNPAHPFGVFANLGFSGKVRSVESVSLPLSGKEVLLVQSDPSDTTFLPVCGFAREAEIGDYILDVFETSLHLIAREINDKLVCIGPVVSTSLEQLDGRVFSSKLFGNDSVALGQYARFSLLQWAVICGCLTTPYCYNTNRAGPGAGKLPDDFWETVGHLT